MVIIFIDVKKYQNYILNQLEEIDLFIINILMIKMDIHIFILNIQIILMHIKLVINIHRIKYKDILK